MKQDKVNEFVDKTIGSLCINGVEIDFIIDRLKENAKKYKTSLDEDQTSQTRTNYLNWYIIFADKRIKDLDKAREIATKMGISRPDKIFKILKFREKLVHNPNKKVVEFD